MRSTPLASGGSKEKQPNDRPVARRGRSSYHSMHKESASRLPLVESSIRVTKSFQRLRLQVPKDSDAAAGLCSARSTRPKANPQPPRSARQKSAVGKNILQALLCRRVERLLLPDSAGRANDRFWPTVAGWIAVAKEPEEGIAPLLSGRLN